MTRAGTTNALSRELVDPNPRWRLRAACRGQDTEMWFDGDTAAAKAECRRCPVVSDCLGLALANGLTYGVWGGLDEKERRALKKGPARSECSNGHELTKTNTFPSGKCRRCDDTSREVRQIASGAVLVPCRCGRRIAPRKGFLPYHVDRSTGERCPGTGDRAEVKA